MYTKYIIYINNLLNFLSYPIHWFNNSFLHRAQSLHNSHIDIDFFMNFMSTKNSISHNLINLNAGNTQCWLKSRCIDRNFPNISFDWNSLDFAIKYHFRSDFSWNDHNNICIKISRLLTWFFYSGPIAILRLLQLLTL